MASTSANCLDSSFPSVASTAHHIGLHTAAFHFHYFPTMWQDPSVNKAYFLLSGSLLHSGASSACATSSSGDILKPLPFGSVHNHFSDSWITGILYSLSLLRDQCNSLSPCSINYKTCGGDPRFEHSVQYRQSERQEEHTKYKYRYTSKQMLKSCTHH